jgi:uncharacterized protein (DUF58 family)
MIAAGSPPPLSPPSWLGRVHAALNHDFCPWANGWVYWLKHPFWLLLAAAVTAVVCGVFVSPAVLVFGGSLLTLLLVGVAWPWITVRGLSARMRFRHTRSREGEPVEVDIEITNRWPWPAWGLRLTRGFRWGTRDATGGLTIIGVAGWTTESVAAVFHPDQRGVYPLEAPWIETAFPFGLFTARKRLTEWNQLIVWPAATVLQTLPDAVEIESREDRTSDRRVGDVGDVLGTRWFRQGDSLRRVHWAQSARQGRLIVCERQMPVSCALRLVLDLEPAHHGGEGRESSLERLLRVAASIIESMHAQHATVECVIGHETLRVGSSAAELRRCLDALAAIPANGLAECAHHGLCCGPSNRHRAMTEFLLTTGRGFAAQLHRRHWSENHHFILVGASATPVPESCHDHAHCACKPWLELSVDGEVLAGLPRRWERACRVA